ncbi:MAG TPA: hypothetical protein VGW74_10545 [Propionibacteriaceae bacterium]|nr:hypothetical protein [Propionibacteriaceae bacterium]
MILIHRRHEPEPERVPAKALAADGLEPFGERAALIDFGAAAYCRVCLSDEELRGLIVGMWGRAKGEVLYADGAWHRLAASLCTEHREHALRRPA